MPLHQRCKGGLLWLYCPSPQSITGRHYPKTRWMQSLRAGAAWVARAPLARTVLFARPGTTLSLNSLRHAGLTVSACR